MRKTLIIIILSLLLPGVATAQTDTVQWGYKGYHYSVWYDSLPEFHGYYLHQEWPALLLSEWQYSYGYRVPAVPQHVDRPTLVYGVAVTEPIDYGGVSLVVHNQWYAEEYVYLFQKVGDTLELRDSVRWDTITPKLMKLAMNADTQRYGFELVKVYEAMFKNPVLVDSTFYTVSSNNGETAHCSSMYYDYEYLPVRPTLVYKWGVFFSDPQWCPMPSWWEMKEWDMQTRQWNSRSNINSPFFGMHFPMVDYVELIVESADTSMGTAGPVARVARNTVQDIWARAKRGYKFSHWQEDWGVHAERSVYIAQDTTRYTAVFEPAARYRVVGESDDVSAGSVTVGDSVYYEGDTAVLEAFAAEGMKFRHWSNGSTANPLEIVVEGDTVLTAHFSELETYRVEGVSNDDAKGYVVVDDSIHREDDTAVLAAFALPGYAFSSWSTGDTANPLRIAVVSDTVVMAFFAGSGVGMPAAEGGRLTFALSPNPAHGQVALTLRLGAARATVVRVRDAAGREVLRKELAQGTRRYEFDVADLPAGTYFVTLVTKDGTGTQKLVVEN